MTRTRLIEYALVLLLVGSMVALCAVSGARAPERGGLVRRRVRDLTPYRESQAVKDSALYHGAQKEIARQDREIKRLQKILFDHGIEYDENPMVRA